MSKRAKAKERRTWKRIRVRRKRARIQMFGKDYDPAIHGTPA